MLSCLLDPSTCIETAFYNAVTGIPWWVYVAIILVVLGAAWKFAGIPGLVAAAGAIGYLFGRVQPPSRKGAASPWERYTPDNATPPPKSAWQKMIDGDKLD